MKRSPAPTMLVLYALGLTASPMFCACVPPEPVRSAFTVTLLPPALDVNKLLPPPAAAPPLTGTSFDTLPLNGGRYCEPAPGKEDCRSIQPGFLVSETTYARAVLARSDATRLGIEIEVLRKLRQDEWEAVRVAEVAYQKRVGELESENSELRRPSFWDTIKFPVGFVCGAALSALVAYGTVHTVR